MSKASLSGFRLDTYQLHECIGSGSFGEVYRAVDSKQGTVAIKVARQSYDTAEAGIDCSESIALGLFSGAYAGISPAPERLLQLQCERSAQAEHLLPNTRGPFYCGELQYLVMEYLDGISLAQLLKQRSSTNRDYATALNMANKLYELLLKLRCSKLEYHGDIKPQNIIITSKGLRLIDPGYFGALPCREGMIPNAVITTPAYYPCLEPDDAFAAGAILWELCLGRHPLRFSRAEDGQQQLSSGVQLKQKLKMQELSGRYFYSSICDLLLPQVLDPAISNDLQRLLLSAIGLEYSGKNALELELAPAIPTPQEVLEQIKSVIS